MEQPVLSYGPLICIYGAHICIYGAHSVDLWGTQSSYGAGNAAMGHPVLTCGAPNHIYGAPNCDP